MNTVKSIGVATKVKYRVLPSRGCQTFVCINGLLMLNCNTFNSLPFDQSCTVLSSCTCQIWNIYSQKYMRTSPTCQTCINFQIKCASLAPNPRSGWLLAKFAKHVLKFYGRLLVWIWICSTSLLCRPPLWPEPTLPPQHWLSPKLFIVFWLHLLTDISGLTITTSTLLRCLPICGRWNSTTALSMSMAMAATFVYSSACLFSGMIC